MIHDQQRFINQLERAGLVSILPFNGRNLFLMWADHVTDINGRYQGIPGKPVMQFQEAECSVIASLLNTIDLLNKIAAE